MTMRDIQKMEESAIWSLNVTYGVLKCSYIGLKLMNIILLFFLLLLYFILLYIIILL